MRAQCHTSLLVTIALVQGQTCTPVDAAIVVHLCTDSEILAPALKTLHLSPAGEGQDGWGKCGAAIVLCFFSEYWIKKPDI